MRNNYLIKLNLIFIYNFHIFHSRVLEIQQFAYCWPPVVKVLLNIVLKFISRWHLLIQEESEKVGLNLNIQKTKIMASGPITSRQIDGETVETVADYIFLGSKITADGDCSHEIKRCLLLGRKVMTNLDSILQSRDIT